MELGFVVGCFIGCFVGTWLYRYWRDSRKQEQKPQEHPERPIPPQTRDELEAALKRLLSPPLAEFRCNTGREVTRIDINLAPFSIMTVPYPIRIVESVAVTCEGDHA